MTYRRNINLIRGMLGVDKGIDIYDQICRACHATNATPDEILENLMSHEDIEDLRNGDLPYESLKCFIRVWCDMGKPKQN